MSIFYKGKKWSISIVINIIICCLAAITSFAYFLDILGTIHFAEKEESNCAQNLIENLINNVSIQSQARAEVIATLPPVKEAFRNKNKKDLIDILHAAIDGQHDKYGVAEANFYEPPAKIFLRMTELDNEEEEDQSSFRKMIVDAINQGVENKGLEIGRQGLDIRGVYPVIDNAGLIGVFEIGMSFTNVLKLNKKISGFDAGVFVDKDLYQQIATETPKLDKNHYIGNFVNQYSTNKELIHRIIKKEQLDNVTKNKNFIVKDKETKEHFGFIEIPLLDFKGNKIGVLVLIKNYDNYFMIEKQLIIISIAFFFFQIALLMGIANIFINATMLKPFLLLIDLIKAKKINQSLPDTSELDNTSMEIINIKNKINTVD